MLILKIYFNVFYILKRVDFNLFYEINEKEIWFFFDKEFELRFLSNITENLKYFYSF